MNNLSASGTANISSDLTVGGEIESNRFKTFGFTGSDTYGRHWWICSFVDDVASFSSNFIKINYQVSMRRETSAHSRNSLSAGSVYFSSQWRYRTGASADTTFQSFSFYDEKKTAVDAHGHFPTWYYVRFNGRGYIILSASISDANGATFYISGNINFLSSNKNDDENPDLHLWGDGSIYYDADTQGTEDFTQISDIYPNNGTSDSNWDSTMTSSSTADAFIQAIDSPLTIGTPETETVDGITTTMPSYIGINNTTPGYELDVSGNINFTGDLYQNGSAVSFGGSGGSSVFSLNGSDAYYNSGNIGIGNTNPSFTLDVTGSANISSNLNVEGVTSLNNTHIGGSGVTSGSAFTVNGVADVTGNLTVDGDLNIDESTIRWTGSSNGTNFGSGSHSNTVLVANAGEGGDWSSSKIILRRDNNNNMYGAEILGGLPGQGNYDTPLDICGTEFFAINSIQGTDCYRALSMNRSTDGETIDSTFNGGLTVDELIVRRYRQFPITGTINTSTVQQFTVMTNGFGDALMSIIGSRSGTTTHPSSVLFFRNQDSDNSTTNVMGAIGGQVSNDTNNYGGLVFHAFSDGVNSSDPCLTMSRNGNWNFGTTYQDDYTVHVDGTMRVDGLLYFSNSPVDSTVNRVVLYDSSSNSDYGFGINSNTLTYHTNLNHRFVYGSTTSSGGTVGMELNSSNLTVNGALSIDGISNVKTAIEGKQDTLSPGSNISISGNTISSTDTNTTYDVASNGGLALNTSTNEFSLDFTNLNSGFTIPQRVTIENDTVSQLIVKTSSGSGFDAGITIRGARSGSTSAAQAQLRFENNDYQVGVRDLGEISGVVTNHNTNVGGLSFYNFSNGSARTTAMTMNNNGRFHFGSSFQDTYKLQVTGSTNITGDLIVGGNADVNGSITSIDASTDSDINNPFNTVFTSANGYTVFDKCIELKRTSNYRDYYLGLLGNNTSNNNVFAIGADGGGSPDPDVLFAINHAGTSEFSSDMTVGGNSYIKEGLILDPMDMGTTTFTNTRTDTATSTASRENIYIKFAPLKDYSSSDWVYLRQIGSGNAGHLAFDFHDDNDDVRFSIRNVRSSGVDPDQVTEVFKVESAQTTIQTDLVVNGNPGKRIAIVNLRKNEANTGNWGNGSYFDYGQNMYRIGTSFCSESNGIVTLNTNGTYKITVSIQIENQTFNNRVVVGSYVSINNNTGNWRSESNSGTWAITQIRHDDYAFGGSQYYSDYYELDSGQNIRIKTMLGEGSDLRNYNDTENDNNLHLYGRLEIELISTSDLIESGV